MEMPLDTAANQRLLAEQAGHAEFCDRKFLASSPAMYAAMAPAFVTAADRLGSLRELPGGLPVLVIVGEQDAQFRGPQRSWPRAWATRHWQSFPMRGTVRSSRTRTSGGRRCQASWPGLHRRHETNGFSSGRLWSG